MNKHLPPAAMTAAPVTETVHLRPADVVIARFGGIRPLARLIGKDPSTIHRWRQPAAKGGLDGRVPSSAQARLIGLAREHGIELTADDLVLGRTCVVGGGESSGGGV